ncbi:CapA family protein [Microbulbifer sp.]|uniref:CapA family protein n=1 Tax=Microbulbifer sp. TaxID=1908541 RepID=UPI003F31DC74
MAESFTITFCGDTSLGYYYLERSREKYSKAYDRLQNNPTSFFDGVLPLLERSDEIIMNLETVLSHNPGKPIEGKQYPGCDDPDVTIEVLKKLGVTAVTLANNHTMDFGPDNLLAMIEKLKSNGIATIGAGINLEEARSPYRIETKIGNRVRSVYVFNGMRATSRYIQYGFFAKKNRPGIANTNLKEMVRGIRKVKESDPDSIVIACPHWQGIDYQDTGENHKEWCRNIIDAGADHVVAHGSHKADIVETYGGGRIFLSIGNFVFNSPGRYRAKGAEPYSLVPRLILGNDREISKGTFSVSRIITDNRKTNFMVGLAKEENRENDGVALPGDDKMNEQEVGMKLRDFLNMIEGKCRFHFEGSYEDSFLGLAYAIQKSNDKYWIIIMGDRFSESVKEKYKQAGKSLEELVVRCENLGINRFVAPMSMKGEKCLCDKQCIFVDNTNDFLYKTADLIRENITRGKLIAITGSVGKSTTKAMLNHVLSKHLPQRRIFSPGINQNVSSNVLSHMSKNHEYDYSIFEVAASCLMRFKRRNFSISPDVAVVTSISEAHLDYLESIEGVAATKSEIFSQAPSNSVAVINCDTPHADLLMARATKEGSKLICYGKSDVADIRLDKFDFSRSEVEANVLGERVSYTLGAPGEHMAMNSLAVIAVMIGLKVEGWRDALSYFSSYTPLIGRGEIFKASVGRRQVTIIDESYNANPASMSASLDLLKGYELPPEGRKIAVIGDIMELGDSSRRVHAELAEKISRSNLDKVFLVGEYIEEIWMRLPQNIKGGLFPSVRGVYTLLRSELRDGDILLLKASNSICLSKISSRFKSGIVRNPVSV